MLNHISKADMIGDAKAERAKLIDRLNEESSLPPAQQNLAIIEGLGNLILAKTAEIDRLEAEWHASGFPKGHPEGLPKPQKIRDHR